MRNYLKTLSLVKAIAGIFLFLAIDSCALVLFESSVLATTCIAYGSCVTASARLLPSLLAFCALILMTFLKGAPLMPVALAAGVFWVVCGALRKYVRYSSPVRAILIGMLLLICENGSWYLAKLILNALWIAAGVSFFV